MPVYSVYVDDDTGTTTFVLFEDSNSSYDVLSIDTDSSTIVITTTAADTGLHG